MGTPLGPKCIPYTYMDPLGKLQAEDEEDWSGYDWDSEWWDMGTLTWEQVGLGFI